MDSIGEQSDRSDEQTGAQLDDNKYNVNSDPKEGYANTGIKGSLGRTLHVHLNCSLDVVFPVGNKKKEKPGNDLLSQPLARLVPSALEGLTAVFGMGTGVAPPPYVTWNLYNLFFDK